MFSSLSGPRPRHRYGAALLARWGTMSASVSDPGGQDFLRRARYFARRELYNRGAPPVSVRMLSHFLLYLSGASAAQIAMWEEERREAVLPRLIKHEDVTPQDAADWAAVPRRDVARHLLACMAILGNGAHRARIACLAAQMGRINLEPRDCEMLTGPWRRSRRQMNEVA